MSEIGQQVDPVIGRRSIQPGRQVARSIEKTEACRVCLIARLPISGRERLIRLPVSSGQPPPMLPWEERSSDWLHFRGDRGREPANIDAPESLGMARNR